MRLSGVFLLLFLGIGASTAHADPVVEVIGERGSACLHQVSEAAGPETAGSNEAMIELTIAFQRCWQDASILEACPARELLNCGPQIQGKVVSARYAATMGMLRIPSELRKWALVMTGMNRPAKWAECLVDQGYGAEPTSTSQQAVMRSAVADLRAHAFCDVVFGLMDISVVHGLRQFAEAQP